MTESLDLGLMTRFRSRLCREAPYSAHSASHFNSASCSVTITATKTALDSISCQLYDVRRGTIRQRAARLAQRCKRSHLRGSDGARRRHFVHAHSCGTANGNRRELGSEPLARRVESCGLGKYARSLARAFLVPAVSLSSTGFRCS